MAERSRQSTGLPADTVGPFASSWRRRHLTVDERVDRGRITLPDPWEWDVKRLAASFEIMGRDRGFSPATRTRTNGDYAAFAAAIDSGRLVAQTGV